MPFADIGAPLCVSSNCLALSTGHMMTRLAHARHIHLPTLTSARFAVDTRLMLAASIRLPAHTSILTLLVHPCARSNVVDPELSAGFMSACLTTLARPLLAAAIHLPACRCFLTLRLL